jgi:hypothetical protein
VGGEVLTERLDLRRHLFSTARHGMNFTLKTLDSDLNQAGTDMEAQPQNAPEPPSLDEALASRSFVAFTEGCFLQCLRFFVSSLLPLHFGFVVGPTAIEL